MGLLRHSVLARALNREAFGYYTLLRGEPEAVTVRDSLILSRVSMNSATECVYKGHPKTLYTQVKGHYGIISISTVVCLKTCYESCNPNSIIHYSK